MHKRNTEVRTDNRCCRDYSQSVFVALHIRHGTRMRHNVIRGLFDYILFFHIISPMAQFSGRKNS